MIRMVKLQQSDSNAPCRRQRYDLDSHEAEMIYPTFPPRMEKGSDSARLGVQRGQICTFVFVTNRTGESQVFRFGQATMLLGDDMVYFMGNQNGSFWNQAILATPSGAVIDLLSQR